MTCGVPHKWPGRRRKPHPREGRGGDSAILSAETLERLRQENPDLQALTVAVRRHAPLPDGPGVAAPIGCLLARLVPWVPG